MKHIEKSVMCILREVSVKFLKDFAIWISCKRLRFLLFFFLVISSECVNHDINN